MFAFGPLERLIIATHAAWFYLGKLFWPAKLTFIYPQWTIEPDNPFSYIWLVAGIALCAAIYFAGVTWGEVWRSRRHFSRDAEPDPRIHHALHVSLHVRGRPLPISSLHRRRSRWFPLV